MYKNYQRAISKLFCDCHFITKPSTRKKKIIILKQCLQTLAFCSLLNIAVHYNVYVWMLTE